MWRLSEISFLLPAVKWELPPAGLVSNCCHDCLDLSCIARYQKGAFRGVPNLPPLLWRQTKSAPGAPRRRRAKLGPAEHNTSVGTLFSGASVSEGPRDEGRLGFPEAPVWNFGGDRGGWPELFLHLGIDSVRMPRKNPKLAYFSHASAAISLPCGTFDSRGQSFACLWEAKAA